MDAENYVPISLIASFKLIRRLTDDLQLIIDVLKGMKRSIVFVFILNSMF